MLSNEDIQSLSPHLFWDVAEVQWPQHKRFLVQRILEYGSLEDFKLLRSRIGMNGITAIAKEWRRLDDKNLNYVTVLFNTPLTEFRCYNTKRYRENYLGF